MGFVVGCIIALTIYKVQPEVFSDPITTLWLGLDSVIRQGPIRLFRLRERISYPPRIQGDNRQSSPVSLLLCTISLKRCVPISSSVRTSEPDDFLQNMLVPLFQLHSRSNDIIILI